MLDIRYYDNIVCNQIDFAQKRGSGNSMSFKKKQKNCEIRLFLKVNKLLTKTIIYLYSSKVRCTVVAYTKEQNNFSLNFYVYNAYKKKMQSLF